MNDRLSALQPGIPAPDFSLPRSSHASISLADLRGRCVILVFYPADWEPVSRQQLALYQDYLSEFTALGAGLLGISADHVWSHGAFARAANLRYPLLSDAHPRGAVARTYGVYDAQADRSKRALFVLDEEGITRWSQTCPAAVNPGVDGILGALESLVSRPSVNEPTQKP